MKLEKRDNYPGTMVEFQNMTLIIPPFNFYELNKCNAQTRINNVIKEFQLFKDAANGIPELPKELMDEVAELIYLPAKRNYPELSLDDLLNGLDLDTMLEIVPLLQTQAKISRVSVETIKNEVPPVMQA